MLFVTGKKEILSFERCMCFDSEKRYVETEFGLRVLVTGVCKNIQANFSLLSICNGHSVRLLFWHIGKLLLFVRLQQHNLDLPCVMGFLLALH